MIACTDVHYEDRRAVAACVLFRDWPDERPCLEVTASVNGPAAYEPGRFYRRELPALLSVIGTLPRLPGVVVVDGYVWLGNPGRAGLGAHLFEALGKTVAVIGVAKTFFADGPAVRAVRRGNSVRPLYVSAAGMDLDEAAGRIIQLHGPFRVPTLLKRADRLCRGLIIEMAQPE